MASRWLVEKDRFLVLTHLLRRTLDGGVVHASDLSQSERSIVEDGIEDEVFEKRAMVLCGNCGKHYSLKGLPDSCGDCGNELPHEEDANPRTIQFYCEAYPDLLREEIGDSIGDLEVRYDHCRVDELSIQDLQFPDEERVVHISPFFDIDSDFQGFPNHNDVFVGWSDVPDIARNEEKIQGELEDFFRSLADERRLANSLTDSDYRSGGPAGPQNGSPHDTSWYTKLRNTSKDVANKQSKARFGVNYNEQFERLGNEFLHQMFPHAVTVQGGGKNQPDGYLILEDRTYFVEAKCYSSGFKLFSEQDKASRYIRTFKQEIEDKPYHPSNLAGYIFIAHKFTDSALEEDIRSLLLQNFDSSLDVICVNDLMMADTVNRLSSLYREEPSAPHRVRDSSKSYKEILEYLARFTREFGADEARFDQILEELVDIAEAPSTLENVLEKGFEKQGSFAEGMEKRIESLS